MWRYHLEAKACGEMPDGQTGRTNTALMKITMTTMIITMTTKLVINNGSGITNK